MKGKKGGEGREEGREERRGGKRGGKGREEGREGERRGGEEKGRRRNWKRRRNRRWRWKRRGRKEKRKRFTQTLQWLQLGSVLGIYLGFGDKVQLWRLTCSLFPSAPVSLALSLPAKSTKLILLTCRECHIWKHWSHSNSTSSPVPCDPQHHSIPDHGPQIVWEWEFTHRD